MQTSLLRVFLILLSITVLSWLAVDTFYTILSPGRSVDGYRVPTTTVEQPSRVSPAESVSAYEIVSSRNLFGTVEQKDDLEVTIDVDTLEPTKLNLALLGTVSGDKDDLGYAVIEEKGKKNQALYREGDSIAGARLVKVMRTRVILNVNDKNEVLAMEEPQKGAPGSSTASAARKPPAPPPVEQTISLERSTIDDALQDAGRIMTDVRVRPFFSGGAVDGFMVSSIVPGSIFQQMGLQNGDVIREVDGQALRNPNDLLELYQNLGARSEMTVNIRRRGRDELLQYRITD